MTSCVTWRRVRPQQLLTRIDRRHIAGVFNCHKQTATVGVCCWQSSSVPLTTAVVWRQSRTRGGQLPFAVAIFSFDPLMAIGTYSGTSNNMKLVHWPLMGRLLHIVQRGGDWAGLTTWQPAHATPCCTKCNSPRTNQRSVYQSPYRCPLLYGFNAPFKVLISLLYTVYVDQRRLLTMHQHKPIYHEC